MTLLDNPPDGGGTIFSMCPSGRFAINDKGTVFLDGGMLKPRAEDGAIGTLWLVAGAEDIPRLLADADTWYGHDRDRMELVKLARRRLVRIEKQSDTETSYRETQLRRQEP